MMKTRTTTMTTMLPVPPVAAVTEEISRQHGFEFTGLEVDFGFVFVDDKVDDNDDVDDDYSDDDDDDSDSNDDDAFEDRGGSSKKRSETTTGLGSRSSSSPNPTFSLSGDEHSHAASVAASLRKTGVNSFNG